MARSSFRALRKSITPRWLTEGEGGLVGYALDLVKDAFAHRAYLGLLASMPEVAPADANAASGRDRRVVPAISETPARYAERLITYLDDRRLQGSPYALLDRLREYLGSGVMVRVVDNGGNWYTLNVDGTKTTLRKQANWDWDSHIVSNPSALWSRFWIIVYPTPLGWTISPHTFGSGDPDWGRTDYETSWGVHAPKDQLVAMRNIAADWKPENARCVNIILAFDDASFDPSSPEPDGYFGNWSKNVGGVQVPARLSTARYLQGV